MTDQSATAGPITIAAQGSYAAGGTVHREPGVFNPRTFFSTAGGENRGDHAYVRYQRPVRARRLPLVFWHGGGQFMRTWETTPDGREGFDTLMLRRDWEVHLMDQPRRGAAGNSNSDKPPPVGRDPMDASLWQVFRLGVYPDFFPGVAFPTDPASVDQYWRQRTPDTGPADLEVLVAGAQAVLDRTGPAVLISHSASGRLGFVTGVRQPNVRAIVSYEPVTFVMPDSHKLRDIPAADPRVSFLGDPVIVTDAEFDRLTKIPIQVVYGDNMPMEPSEYPGLDLWRMARLRAYEFADLINGRGGDCTVLELPDAGLKGNTHFPFSDLNNVAVADLFSDWLNSRGLDDYA